MEDRIGWNLSYRSDWIWKYDKRNETRTESRVSVDDDDDETNIPSFLRKRGF